MLKSLLSSDLILAFSLVAACSAPSRTATGPSSSLSRPRSAPACQSYGAPDKYWKAVDGRHRGCSSDQDCVTVLRSCSNTDCTAVNRRFGARYAKPLDCKGYTGRMANYDCRPRFNSERPACRAGCCVTEKLKGR